MRNNLTYILFLFICSNVTAQDLVFSSDIYPELVYYGLSGDVFYNDYKNVKGSAFYDNEWLMGTITLKNGAILRNINLKFDLYTNSLIVYHDFLHHQVLLDKPMIREFSWVKGNEEMRFVAREITGIQSNYESTDNYIMQVLADGEISLYKLMYKKMQKQSKSNETATAAFLDRREYHVLIEGQNYYVRRIKGLLIMHYPDYKSEIRTYIRQNNLKVRKEKNMIELIRFLNTMLEGNK